MSYVLGTPSIQGYAATPMPNDGWLDASKSLGADNQQERPVMPESPSTTRSSRINNTTRAYIAGLFDGEGYLCSTKQESDPYSHIRVAIVNQRLDVLEWIRDLVGGSIQTKSVRSNRLSQKPCYELHVHNVRNFLQVIRPYVRIKRDQLEVACAFYSLPRGAGEKKKRLAAKIAVLNGRSAESVKI